MALGQEDKRSQANLAEALGVGASSASRLGFETAMASRC